MVNAALAQVEEFQSTSLREGRLKLVQNQCKTPGFNPCPCARGDDLQAKVLGLAAVSIHAPV